MSRRTKLLITALFLVLLAIPVVYLVCTWSVQDPLRFRIVSEEEIRGQDGPLETLLHIEVTNVTSTPIHLSVASLARRDVSTVPISGGLWNRPGRLIVWPNRDLVIPPRGTLTIEATSPFPRTQQSVSSPNPMDIYYSYASSVRRIITNHWPLRDKISPPTEQEAATPLELKPSP